MCQNCYWLCTSHQYLQHTQQQPGTAMAQAENAFTGSYQLIVIFCTQWLLWVFQILYTKNMSVYSQHDTGILHTELIIKIPMSRLYNPIFPRNNNSALLHNIMKDHNFPFTCNLPVLIVVVVWTHCAWSTTSQHWTPALQNAHSLHHWR